MRLSRIDGWARAHDGQLDGPGAPSVQAAAATTPTRDRARAAPTRVQSHARVLAGHVVRGARATGERPHAAARGYFWIELGGQPRHVRTAWLEIEDAAPLEG